MKIKLSTIFGLCVVTATLAALMSVSSQVGLYLPGYEPIVTDRFTHPVRIVRKPVLPGKEMIHGWKP